MERFHLLVNMKPGALLPVFIFATIGFGVGLKLLVNFGKVAEEQNICRLIYDHHYLGEKQLRTWFGECLKIVRESDESEMVAAIEEHLSIVPGSHLSLLDAEEGQILYEGIGKITGLRFRGINGRIILYDILDKQLADIPLGSELLRIDGQPVLSLNGLDRRSGTYEFKKDGKVFRVEVSTVSATVNRPPWIEKLGPGEGLLRIESFREIIFTPGWNQVLGEIEKFKKLTVDLRGNWGGAFGPFVQALAPFLCGQNEAGRLFSPRRLDRGVYDLNEFTEDQKLVRLLGDVGEIRLKPESRKPCFRGELRVLVDEETRSVAEMFAAVLSEVSGAKVEGQKTAGAVVMAVFYDIEFYGQSYSLSIPEYLYESPEGKLLEGVGIEPDKYLYYDLSRSLRGIDSWL